jgi:hypothetical protein
MQQAIQCYCRIVGLFMDNELERKWEEAVVAYCNEICLEGLQKPRGIFSQVNRSPSRDLKLQHTFVTSLKISVFWDIALCSPFKVNRRYSRLHHFHLQGWRLGCAWIQHETSKTSNCLHCVIARKSEIFITTAEDTWNPMFWPQRLCDNFTHCKLRPWIVYSSFQERYVIYWLWAWQLQYWAQTTLAVHILLPVPLAIRKVNTMRAARPSPSKHLKSCH